MVRSNRGCAILIAYRKRIMCLQNPNPNVKPIRFRTKDKITQNIINIISQRRQNRNIPKSPYPYRIGSHKSLFMSCVRSRTNTVPVYHSEPFQLDLSLSQGYTCTQLTKSLNALFTQSFKRKRTAQGFYRLYTALYPLESFAILPMLCHLNYSSYLINMFRGWWTACHYHQGGHPGSAHTFILAEWSLSRLSSTNNYPQYQCLIMYCSPPA